MQVIEISNIDDLAPYRELWWRLLTKTPDATFFQSLEWLEAYWKHYGDSQTLRVLIISESDEPAGIVPLVVRRIPTRFGKSRILTFPLNDWGSFYGPIGGNAEWMFGETMRYLRGRRRDWDMIDFRWLHSRGSTAGTAASAMKQSGLRPVTATWDQTALVELEGDWESYLQSRSGKCRQTYNRAERRIAQDGNIEFVRYRPKGAAFGDADPKWDLYEACEQIAAKSWQGSSTDGTTLTHDSVRDFLRDVHAAASHLGCADISLVTVADKPAAFGYNYHFQGWVYSVRVGFDPEISNKGLGRLLMGRMIRDSFERGDHVIDMGVGSLECKNYWLTSVEPIQRQIHFAAGSPNARLLSISRKIGHWLRRRHAERAPRECAKIRPI